MRLGVTVLRQHLLEDSSDILELAEAFGQSEALTTRLKHIIGKPGPHLPPFPLQTIHTTHPALPTSLHFSFIMYPPVYRSSHMRDIEPSQCARCFRSNLWSFCLESVFGIRAWQNTNTQSFLLFLRGVCDTDAYVDGPGIVMELIQNADDAGATEVGLMLDMHTYPTERMVGKYKTKTYAVLLPYYVVFP